MTQRQPKPPFEPSETTETVQLLVADAGNRSAICGMLDEQFDVETSQTLTDADLYLIEDHLFPEYRAALRERIDREHPAFCPIVLIRRESTDLGQEGGDATDPDAPVRYDEVVAAPINPPQLVRRLNSLLVRRQQSQELMEQVSTLEEREQRLRLFEHGVESTGNGIVMTDPDGTIEYVNPALESITGYTEDDILGESPQILLPEGTGEVFDKDFWRTMVDQTEWEGDIIIEGIDSHRLVVNATATELLGENNETQGFVIVLSDITDRIQREQDLEDREVELDLLRQILTRYLRHNLRNDLTVIQGNAQMLVEDETLSPKQIELAETIIENSENLLEMSDTARTYSSLLDRDAELSAFDLSEITTTAVQNVRESFPDVNFEIDVPETCDIRAREGIQRALEELIDNAARHNDAADPWVRIQVRDRDGARLVIEDNGPGITDLERESLNKGSETQLIHSQGVGLWLSKWIIEGVDGQLSIELSDPGTRVIADFPPTATVGSTGLEVATLKEREQRLQTITDRMTDAIIKVDADWNVTKIDGPAEDVLNLDADAVVGDGFWDVFSELRDTQFETAVRNTMDSRNSMSVEEYVAGIDTWVEVNVYPEFDGGLSFYIRDVTEREVQLRRERSRLSALFENSNDSIVYTEFVDGEPRIQDVNEAFVETFGYDEDEAIGRPIDELVVPDDTDKAQEATELNRRIEAGERVVAEVRRQTQDGVRDFLLQSTPLELGESNTETYANYIDITERKERERTLERHETITETAGDPVYALDSEGCFTFVNDAMIEVTGYGENSLLYEHASMVMDMEDVERGEELIRSLISSDRDRGTFEMDLVTASGRRIPVENHIGLLPFDETFRGTVGILRDITDRKEREVQLQLQNERLDAFTSVVSHDLRNPLNVASGRLELAKDDCDSEHLTDVDHALHRMETLIDDLLELARLGDAVSERESIALNELLDTCWATVETTDATLDSDIERTITADESRLKQVFENFFRNAIEHGGDDVTITVGELDDGFYIEDDGPGIPDAEHEEIFEAGYSTSEEGTGFGLSIVKEIVEAHGWEITVTEGTDGGARFEITGVEYV